MTRFGHARLAILAFVLSASASLTLSGCGGESSSTPSGDKPPAPIVEDAQAKQLPTVPAAK